MLARLANAFRRTDSNLYELLPTTERAGASGHVKARVQYYLRWRVWRRCVIATLFVVVLVAAIALAALFVFVPKRSWIWRTRVLAVLFGPKPLPPLYPEFRKAELALPQHHVKDPFADGQKYLWVASHTSWSGWGNFMQDMVMTAHLTHRSGRTYVFDDYTWDKHGPPYSMFDDKRWIPSRIPLSAVISGPIVGGPFADDDTTPRAIAKAHWEKICPNPIKINGEEVRAIHGSGADATRIEEAWLEYLSKIDDPCVEVPESSGSIFHIL
ncbi:uncharacterized protein PHACADRAFT_200992 [Phanerochaete carnosa HHB-10118-sp]|uniref:Uncharacterized protein n=1 Tax=Phanerochaete carnosa (strain HHB-10118-sp) TaxID=650164 RepID=K5VG24_PHACS|nr:uncharacterized protein PHACADRAFT_200992 [Phanerochaete carnosa HHB-10118-sp]EKM50148.1 hypothetical protein PHACADRAFT_200992 [Phanerochaete carnosa HHB-10118-sp]